MPIRMIGPEGHSGFAHAGKSYRPSKDGIVALPDQAVAAARSHGFRMEGEPEPKPAPTKDERIAALQGALAARDIETAELKERLAMRDETIVERDTVIAALEKQVAELTAKK